jgi:hypothetical protein
MIRKFSNNKTKPTNQKIRNYKSDIEYALKFKNKALFGKHPGQR